MSDAVNDLWNWLEAQGEEIPVTELAGYLKKIWDDLAGADAESMSAEKLDRLEMPNWQPPKLSFQIERHGGMKFGSSRGEIQTWCVDLRQGTASVVGQGYRQRKPRNPPFRAEAEATSIANAIVEGRRDDPRFSWREDGTVQINLEGIPEIANQAASQQTLADRRRRFRNALVEVMASPSHGYEPAPTSKGGQSLYIFRLRKDVSS